MTFSRWVFGLAGIYGLILLVPHYFMESHVAHAEPAGLLTHPEFFYGFLGVGIAWQIAFLIIAQNPVRFRPMIIPAVVEKFSFAAAVGVLFFQNRVPAMMLVAGLIDLTWGVLFVVSWQRLGAPTAKK
jgi:hypothetical protein